MFRMINTTFLYRTLILMGVIFFLVIVTSFAHTSTGYVSECSNSGSVSVICGTLDNISSAVTSKEGGNFLTLLSLFALSVAFFNNRPSNQASVLNGVVVVYNAVPGRTFRCRIHDHMVASFRKGIVHPKLYNTAIIS